MNHSYRSTLPAAALMAFAGAAAAATLLVPFAASASTATPTVPSDPVSSHPNPDPTVDHILRAMGNASTWGHPDQFGEYAGMQAYSEGHYQAALKYFKYGARYANKLSQLSIGLMYENGRGVEKDPVTACAWLALAAQRKYPKFVETRDRVCEALTPAQHDQAVAVLDKLLPEYGDKVAKKRMTLVLNLAKKQTAGSRLGFDSGITVVGVRQNCVGGTVLPQTGCGSTNFWSPWRWDPQKYFKARDAQWSGTVTVGALQDKNAPATSAKAEPAPASSVGH